MRKLTTQEFLEKFYEKYPDGLNLDLSKFAYTTARTKSLIICNIHKIEYFNTANNLLQGIKCCKLCKSSAIANVQRYNLNTFVEKSKQIHKNRYDYSKTVYKDIRSKVNIICKKHGEFLQHPQSHWAGYGCPQCGYTSLRKTKEQFVATANKIHNNRYDYTTSEYTNNYTKLKICCHLHGEFDRTPVAHTIYQRGCPACYPGNQSWVEISWLDSLRIPEDNRQKRITIGKKTFLVDAKVENTIYEFWGDFWHGNPEKFLPYDVNGKCGKTFNELYTETMKKRDLILSAGYNLVEIWESNYRDQIK
jgi:hypothetical protein